MAGVLQDKCLEAQTAIIGSMLIDAGCIGGVLTAVSEEDFPSGAHRTVFGVIKDLFSAGDPVDAVIVAGKLDKAYRQFLMECMEVTPTAAHAGEYCKLLRENARLLQLQGLGEQLRTVSDLDTARALSEKVNRLMVERSGLQIFSAKDLAMDFYKRMSSEKKPEYIPIGIRELDEKVYIEPGDMVGIGGLPSSGKTAFSLQWAASVATKYRVGYFSLETNEEKTADRIAANNGEIPLSDIKNRIFAEDAWGRIADVCSKISMLKLEFVPAPGMTAADIMSLAVARRYQIIFIDYLQLIVPSNQHDMRHEQVAEISRTLHTAAQRNRIAVVALSQLSRLEKNKAGKLIKPDMHSFRDSGQIEQDLDLGLMIYAADPALPQGDRVFKIVKNKEGQRGEITMSFDGRVQKFSPSQKATMSQFVKAGKKARRDAAQLRMEEDYAAAEAAGKEFEEVGEAVPF